MSMREDYFFDRGHPISSLSTVVDNPPPAVDNPPPAGESAYPYEGRGGRVGGTRRPLRDWFHAVGTQP